MSASTSPQDQRLGWVRETQTRLEDAALKLQNVRPDVHRLGAVIAQCRLHVGYLDLHVDDSERERLHQLGDLLNTARNLVNDLAHLGLQSTGGREDVRVADRDGQKLVHATSPSVGDDTATVGDQPSPGHSFGGGSGVTR